MLGILIVPVFHERDGPVPSRGTLMTDGLFHNDLGF